MYVPFLGSTRGNWGVCEPDCQILTNEECDTDWTIWEKGETRKDGYFTLAVYQYQVHT